MKKFAVTGNPIFHSLSPQIFNYFFKYFDLDAAYSRLTAEAGQEIIDLVKRLDIAGLSITAPFKPSVIELVDSKDKNSTELHAINTVINDGILSAFNTDVPGIQKSLENYNINDKNCIIFGAGGAAAAAVKAVLGKVKSISVLNRTENKARALSERFNVNYSSIKNIDEYLRDRKLVINTIPGHSDFDFDISMPQGSIFLDANYVNNDYQFKIIEQGVEYISGHIWLLNQAKSAFKLFYDINAEDIRPQDVFRNETKLTRFALIGFMGAGKTTTGKELAESLGFKFVDTDLEIEEHFGKSINRIFSENGEAEFRKVESEILSSYKEVENLILSCGGGIIENPDNISILKANYRSIYLYSDLKTCMQRASTNNRPLRNKDESEIENLYNSRLDKYYSASDLIIDSGKDIDSITKILSNEIKAII